VNKARVGDGKGRLEMGYSYVEKEKAGRGEVSQYLIVLLLDTDWEACYRLIDLLIRMVGPLCVPGFGRMPSRRMELIVSQIEFSSPLKGMLSPPTDNSFATYYHYY
jgi:hypothetical protein